MIPSINGAAVAAARSFQRRGIHPVPVAARGKRPIVDDWPSRRFTDDEIEAVFAGSNVGIVLGDPTGIVDVDLDCPEAIELADEFLPPTGRIFGRASARKSHRLYRVNGAAGGTKRFTFESGERAGQIIAEYRATGGQTVVPPSIHASGEAIEWDLTREAATVTREELIAALTQLADAVDPSRRVVSSPPSDPAYSSPVPPDGAYALDRFRRYAIKMPDSISGQGGHRAFFTAMCTARRFGVPAELMPEAGSWWSAEKSSPAWSDREIEHKVEQAVAEVPASSPDFGSMLAPPTPAPSPALMPSNEPDSFRSLERGGETKRILRPVPLSELGPSQPPAWVWHGYLAHGFVTLLTGRPKAGKTTLVSHLLHDLAHGVGLVEDRATQPVLVVSEEATGHWIRRRDELGLGDEVHLVNHPFPTRPTHSEWETFCEEIVLSVRSDPGYGVVLFDTLPSLWPVEDENAAAQVIRAVTPIRSVSEAGAAVLVTHHPRKGDASEGMASRGSSALPGAVDVIVDLRRYAKEDNSDTRRVLTSFSRFEETPAEAVFELGDGGYRYVGDCSSQDQSDRIDVISGLVSGKQLTVNEVHAAWPTSPAPSKRRVREDLEAGTEAGRWHRSGVGKKGDPHRYGTGPIRFVSTHTLGERNESEGVEAPDMMASRIEVDTVDGGQE